jgi:predicted permease
MRLWHILHTRLWSLLFRERRESDLREEMQFHLERETERLEAAGVRPDAARLQALRTFGAVEPTKEACRDARGTVLVDSLVRDLRFACRSFRRAPLVVLTVVTTVGLGLGLVASVFTILNAQIFQVDEVRNPYELFAVERQRSAGAQPEAFTRAQYDALVRETAVFSDAFASRHGEALIEGRRMEGPLVTGNFFQVLGVSAARGRTLTSSDDEPGRPPVIVLSHRTWSRHFASDPGVIDRTIRVNGASFQVVGVMPEGFRGLAVIAPEFWAPLSLLDEFRRTLESGESSGGLRVVGRLRPGLSREQALAELRAWDARRALERAVERPPASLVLEPSTGTVPLSAETLLPFIPLFFAFGLILLIGCANVANLLFARGVGRQREFGIRMAIGASRRRVIWQLLAESLLLALLSAVLGFGISRLVLNTVVYAVTSTFPTDIGHINIAVPPADWRVALFLVFGALASTLFFALVPALQATRLELVRAIRGEVVRDGRPGRARDALVALQVTASALLLICAAVFLRSAWASATVDPGIRTAGVVTVRILDEQRRGVILDVVNGDPVVASVAAAFPGFMGGLGGFSALAEGANGKSRVTAQFVSPEFFDVLGIDVVRGRGFSQAERSADAAVAVVSESVARELWPGIDAVGQILRVEPNPPDPSRAEGTGDWRAPDDLPLRPFTVDVVGIVRDVAGVRLGGVRLGGAGVYVPTSAEAARTTLTMRVHGDAERARRALIDRLAAIDANMGEVSTMQTIARAEAYLLGIPFWLTLVLGTLALLLTLSGLFSVLSYLVEQRTREIGMRMALGATRRGIAALVLSQSARPVGVGLLLGSSVTAALGAALLATPAAELIGSTVRLLDPVAYAAGLLWIVAACTCAALIPALRAARIDPIGALRQD